MMANKTFVLLFGENSYPLYRAEYYEAMYSHMPKKCWVTEKQTPVLLPWKLFLKGVCIEKHYYHKKQNHSLTAPPTYCSSFYKRDFILSIDSHNDSILKIRKAATLKECSLFQRNYFRRSLKFPLILFLSV